MFNDSGNHRDFKKGMDSDAGRRRREDDRLRLRRAGRERQLQKRRAGTGSGDNPTFMNSEQTFSDSFGDDPDIHERLAQLPQYVQGIWSDHPQVQFECATKIRRLLSIERSPPIQEVIDSGAVPRLIHFLKEGKDRLQFEAAWALTNIASGNSTHTQVVIHHGAVPVFINLLSCPNHDVVEQAVWAIGNIAGDSPELRNMVLAQNALQRLIPLCNPHEGLRRMTLLRNAAWTLSNLCRGKPQPEWKFIEDALPVLTSLLSVGDEEVLTDVCWAFSYLSDDTGPGGERIAAIIDSGALKKLVDLLEHPSNAVKHPALRTIGNIVTGDDMQTQVVLNSGALQKLLSLLDSNKKSIKKEACWTISNITAGNVEQIEAVIHANLIQPLVSLLRHDEFDVKKEAAWAISNATSGGNARQIRFLVNQGCIPPLCNLFTCGNSRIIMVALEGIENILRVGEDDRGNFEGINKYAQFVEECGGLDGLEQLQTREDIDMQIFEKVVPIIRQYFDGEEEEIGLAPQASDGQFTFGGGFDGSNGQAFQF